MSHGTTLSKDDIRHILAAPAPELGTVVKVVLWTFVIGGALAFWNGISTAGLEKQSWASFHVSFVYWFIFSVTATGFTAVFHICNAQWVRPIRRLFESVSYFPLWLIIPFTVLWFGHGEIFSWAHEEIPGKGNWLTSKFLFGRNIIALGLVIFMVRRAVKLSIARDIVAIRSGLTGASKEEVERYSAKCYDSFAIGQGREGIKSLSDKLGVHSPAMVIVFALGMSLFGFDFMMSVDPHWYSTLFGVYTFMAGVYLTMAWVSILQLLVRGSSPLYSRFIQSSTLHDLGKLLFGFGIFWAYLFWSHYLTIWYGNIPEETAWVITRLRLEPWHAFAWRVFGACFVVPFLLGLNIDIKRNPLLLCLTGAIVCVGLWLFYYLLFVPTLFPDTIPLSLRDLIIYLGFMGAFLLSSFSFLSKYPLIPVGDLLE